MTTAKSGTPATRTRPASKSPARGRRTAEPNPTGRRAAEPSPNSSVGHYSMLTARISPDAPAIAAR